ncbi:tRNA (guanine(10)-N2)-methyltransferase [Penicillium argentinense]|uniref:tRNA (Guanine(10)-N2)-methyltransferase n=1 Tax=Penicillium argentinense TaxID=1131581 RepID=A0A9W9EX38_9EURO|nr:tRNA (guanine(10)-N2)-methyltransferase [Penicillium argentinense]KAJ5089496.1 tRNA (guanine(10)-N2)-methyltransferase [Penicillium argentinense]
MEYLIRFAQVHETFRQPEIQALATLAGVDLEIVSYDDYSPYCIVKLQDEAAARAIITRSILAKDISELWGQGTNYEGLHAQVHQRTQHRWTYYREKSFAFAVDTFAGKRSQSKKSEIIKSFAYMGLEGPIRLRNPDEQFYVMEEYVSDPEASILGTPKVSDPRKIFMGRLIANSNRDIIVKHDLKKRRYISTTSMDAELSLVTANMALAAPGKVFYDPFVGTGSFLVAAAHFGALTLGSDIDPRSFRGKDSEREKGEVALMRNFKQYDLESKMMDLFSSDLTNTPLRNCQLLDGITCDPPYGVREGLRVLGTRDGVLKEPRIIDGVLAHTRPGYVPPKKPYGFEALQKDVLEFAARNLVPNGRLAMWMPTSNDEAIEFPVPMHPNLEVISVSVQYFQAWSRRLMTYRRLPEGELSDTTQGRDKTDARGICADELNSFRRKYFTRNGPKPENVELAQ